MDADKLASLSRDIEHLNLKMDAVCKALKINLDYQPHSYDAVQSEEDGE